MLLKQTYDFDLPVYDRRDVQTELVNIKAKGRKRNTVVRPARIHLMGGLGLKEILAIADETFEEVAEKCGAVVVGHTWGLCKKPSFEPFFNAVGNNDLLPPNHGLVAEVDVIRRPAEPDEATKSLLHSLTSQHRAEKAGYYWSDADPRQFRMGIGPTRANPPALWLVDIEPHLMRRQT